MKSSIALLLESKAGQSDSPAADASSAGVLPPGRSQLDCGKVAHSRPRSKLGGLPDLPEGIEIPIDNRSRPLLFVGQINFAETPRCDSVANAPTTGVLYWFLNCDLSFSNPKDRHSFRVLWCGGAERYEAAQMECAPFETTGVLSFQLTCDKDGVDSPSIDHRLFGELHRFAEEASEIAAFASNGISWSTARRKDSCYEHLVTAAQQWQLLWFLPADLTDHRLPDLALMVNQFDLSGGTLNKAWMVPLPNR